MGNQEERMMLSKEDREMIKEGHHHGDNRTEEKESQFEEEGLGKEEIVLEKDLEQVSRQNHQVDVIKMLKNRKLKQNEHQLPTLNQEKEKEVVQSLKIQEKQSSIKHLMEIIPKDEKVQQKEDNLEKEPEKKKIISFSKQISQGDEHQIQKPPPIKELIPTFTFSTKFSTNLKSQTIELDESFSKAVQNGLYFENQKLILTQPLLTGSAKASFRVENLKYCVGMGLALKEVIENHEFNYKSYANQLSHGLYIVTSQGYSWSHHLKEEDDILHQGFNKLKNNDIVQVLLEGGMVKFSLKEFSFSLEIPSHITQKYAICFCGYLHQKGDSISLTPFIIS